MNEGAADGLTGERLLTERQHRLASLIRERLTIAGVQSDEHVDHNGHEAWYVFEVKTSPVYNLRAQIGLADDMFIFDANGAALHRDRAGWIDTAENEWMKECVRLVTSLVDSDLRIRVRRTLLGRMVGAVWIPGIGDDGCWDGDFKSKQGQGKEFIFPRWWWLRGGGR